MATIPDLSNPILDEIHETRRELLRKHGGIAGLMAFLRSQEAVSTRKQITPPEPLPLDSPSGRLPRN
jgi:hypothetical protein